MHGILKHSCGQAMTTIVGKINSVTIHKTMRGNLMAFISLNTGVEEMEVVVLPDVYEEHEQMFEPARMVRVVGTIQHYKNDESKFIADNIMSIA